jgi:monoamine oxidase
LFTDHGVPATWWTPNPSKAPLITAWAGGPQATLLHREFIAAPRSGLRDKCLASLARIFDMAIGDLENRLVSWHFHDWQSDEFARGAYSYAPAGALDASEKMSEPVEDTLYFAGEHTTTSGHWGTVNGALQSGQAAAAAVLRRPARADA